MADLMFGNKNKTVSELRYDTTVNGSLSFDDTSLDE